MSANITGIMYSAILALELDGTYKGYVPGVLEEPVSAPSLEAVFDKVETATKKMVLEEVSQGKKAPRSNTPLGRAERLFLGEGVKTLNFAVWVSPEAIENDPVRISITLSPALLEKIDKISGNRSAFISQAIRSEIKLWEKEQEEE